MLVFKDFEVELEFGVYDNGEGTAISLIETQTGEYVTTATVNLDSPDFHLGQTMHGERFVAIKDYGENEGMTQFLIDNDFIRPKPVASMRTGFVSVKGYLLTDAAIDLFHEQLHALKEE